MMYLERVGRRTLICGGIGLLVALLFYSRALAQDARPDLSKAQPGRYQIVMHPTFRGDQYLLDTMTGQIWQLVTFTTLQGEPMAWKYMNRIDNPSDYNAFVTSRASNKSESSQTAAPLARAPKPPAPMKLN
jgi:hypothetical protein